MFKNLGIIDQKCRNLIENVIKLATYNQPEVHQTLNLITLRKRRNNTTKTLFEYMNSTVLAKSERPEKCQMTLYLIHNAAFCHS